MARANIGDVLREAGGALGAFGTQRRLSRQEEERMRRAGELVDFLLQKQGITGAPTQGVFGAGGITPQQISGLLPRQEPTQKEVVPTWQREGFGNLEDWKKFQLERKRTGVPRPLGKKEKTPQDLSRKDMSEIIEREAQWQSGDTVKGFSPIAGLRARLEVARQYDLPFDDVLPLWAKGEISPPEGAGLPEGLGEIIGAPETKVTPPVTPPTPEEGVEVGNTQKVISSLQEIKDKKARLAAYEKAKARFIELEVDDAAVRKALGLK